MRPALLPALICCSIHSVACLNYYGVTVDGKQVTITMGGGSRHSLHEHHAEVDMRELEKTAAKLEGLLLLEPSHFKARNDLAVTYIKLGRRERAFPLLYTNLAIDRRSYQTLANLGVAHELSGKLDSAYYYVSNAYQLNRESHFGSEWIHIKLLETALGSNPGKALEDYKMLEIDFGNDKVPDARAIPGLRFQQHRMPYGNDRNEWDTLTRLVTDIEYQLHERTYFIKGNDKFVGELFFTLGDLYSLYFDSYWALWSYTKAMHYGTAHDKLVLKRGLYLYTRLRMKPKPRGTQRSHTVKDYNSVMAFWRKQAAK